MNCAAARPRLRSNRYKRTTSADGSINVTVGSWTREGTVWVQGNFLCNAYPKDLTSCGAIFRNPSGRRSRRTNTRPSTVGTFEFSVVR